MVFCHLVPQLNSQSMLDERRTICYCATAAAAGISTGHEQHRCRPRSPRPGLRAGGGGGVAFCVDHRARGRPDLSLLCVPEDRTFGTRREERIRCGTDPLSDDSGPRQTGRSDA